MQPTWLAASGPCSTLPSLHAGRAARRAQEQSGPASPALRPSFTTSSPRRRPPSPTATRRLPGSRCGTSRTSPSSGARAPTPAYASLLRQAYTAIKQADPQMPVAGASVVGATQGGGSIDGPDFLKTVFEAGSAGSMDAISMHAYSPDQTGSGAVSAVQRVRSVRDTLGDPSRPLWITEAGWSTTGAGLLSEVDQATALAVLDTRAPR